MRSRTTLIQKQESKENTTDRELPRLAYIHQPNEEIMVSIGKFILWFPFFSILYGQKNRLA